VRNTLCASLVVGRTAGLLLPRMPELIPQAATGAKNRFASACV
jgi:hypothetical protein